jgi:hypothetical protein
LQGLGAVDRRELVEGLRALRHEQRLFLHALLASSSFTEAHRKLAESGIVLKRETTARWTRSPIFVNAWRLLEKAYVRNITKDGVIAKTQAVIEHSMTPKPILYKGKATGFEEVDVGAAIRALELQGKAVGAWADEQQKVAVSIDIDFSGRPPALVDRALRDPLEIIEAEVVEVDEWLR